MAYLGSGHVLAAPLMALPEPAPALAPLGAPLTIPHRVISYTYPSTSLGTGDAVVNHTAMTTTPSIYQPATGTSTITCTG